MRILTVAMVVWLSGCAGMADVSSQMAGIGVLKEETSRFDNSRVIEVTPTWLYDPAGSWGNAIKIGARWTDAAPKVVALVMSYGSNAANGNAFADIRGIDVNVDGEMQIFRVDDVSSLSASEYNSVTRTIYTESRNAVVVPYAVFEQMLGGADVRLRIHTSDGYEDARFSVERIPGGQGTAILAFRKLAARVDEYRNAGN